MKQVVRYGVQSLLVILGLAIGVANIIVLISITDLGRRQTVGVINELGANVIVVLPYIGSDGESIARTSLAAPGGHLPNWVVEATASAPGITAVAPVLVLPTYISFDSQNVLTTAFGVTDEFLELRGHQVASGEWMSSMDTENKASSLWLGDTTAAKLFGDENPIGLEVILKGEVFTVAGTMAHKGRVGLEDYDNVAMLPLSTAQRLFSMEGIHGMFARYGQDIRSDQAIVNIKSSIAGQLKPDDDVDETVTLLTAKDATKLMDSTVAIFRTVLGGIASISLIVGGIGIMNVMLIRVVQRRKEIGIRQAAGATRRSIMLQFLAEAVVLAIIGSIAGALLGLFGVRVYCAYTGWIPYVSLGTIGLAMLFSIVLGILFGLLPAYRAANQDPISSLRIDF